MLGSGLTGRRLQLAARARLAQAVPAPLAAARAPHAAVRSVAGGRARGAGLLCRAQAQEDGGQREGLVGEDAAVFELGQQSAQSWGLFVALLTGVSALLYAVREELELDTMARAEKQLAARV